MKMGLDERILMAIHEDKIPMDTVHARLGKLKGGSLLQDDIMAYLLMKLKDVKPKDVAKALKRMYKLGMFTKDIVKEVMGGKMDEKKMKREPKAKPKAKPKSKGKLDVDITLSGGALSDLIEFATLMRGHFDAEEVIKIVRLLIEFGLIELTLPVTKMLGEIAKATLGGRRLGETNEVMLSAGSDMVGGKDEDALLDGLFQFAKALLKFFSREDVQKIIMGLIKTGVVILSKHGQTIASDIAKGTLGGRLGESNEVMLSAGRVLSSQERAMQLEARAALPFVQDDPESRLMLEKLKDLWGQERRGVIATGTLRFPPKDYAKKLRAVETRQADIERRIKRAEQDAKLARRPAIRDMLAAEEVTKIRDKIAMAEGRIKVDKKAEKKRRKRTAKMKAWTDFTKGIREGEVKFFPGNGFEYTRLKGKVRKLKPE